MRTKEECLQYIRNCNSILSELLEDGDEYEEIPYWEEELKNAKEELEHINKLYIIQWD